MAPKKHIGPDQPLRHMDHKRPVSRRDFLAQGFLGGMGLVTAPTILSLMRASEARAQFSDCGIGVGGAGLIPFVCFDLGGGANIAGSNVLVGGPGGQLDELTATGYMKLGLPSDLTPGNAGQVNTDLGLAFHADSPFLAGILSKASPEAIAKTNGCVLCSRSENDTQNNPHNPMYGINKAGASGDLVSLIGSRNSDSGGRSMAVPNQIDPTVRPTKVDRASDARGLVDTGKLITLLSQADATEVARSAEQITDAKLLRIAEDPAVEDLIHCGFAQTTDLISRFGNPDVLDPDLDLDIIGGANPIFTAGELSQSRFRKTAAVMKLVIEGYAGAGTIENGGYDYHDSTRATGEVRDFLAGQMMGATLEFARRRGQPLMLYVFSDGSVFSDGNLDNSAEGRGKGIWKGDNSSTSSAFFLVYDPNPLTTRPTLTTPAAQQLGYFRPTGSIETAATRMSNNVVGLAEAIVLNYMALHGDVAGFANALPMHTLGSGAELDSLVAFNPIVSST